MKTKKDIQVLLENGIKAKTISNMTLSQIGVLAERFNRLETKESTKQTTTNIVYDPNNPTDQKDLATKGIHIDPSTKKISMTVGPTGEVKEDETIDVVNDPDATADGMPTEGEMTEKFESKAQQGLFWAKCNNSTGKTKEKWCKMAKEFSDSTSKKQYKNMPEKKHPEKTVKKLTTNENYEKFLENRIIKMVNNQINPAMTKGKLIQSINERKKSESFILNQPKKNSMFSQDEGKEMKTMKKPIGRMFSMGGEMAEDTKEKTRTRPDTDTDKREKDKDKDRKNPFQPKHRPKPKAKKGEYNEHTVAPTRPDTDTDKREKDKDKDRKNPFQPKHRPKPKAKKGEYNEHTVAPTRPDTDTDKREKDKDKDRKNPFQPKHRPKPKAKKGEYNEHTVAPTRPDTDTDKREKDKDKDRKNPFQPKHRPKPKAKNEKEIPTWLSWNKIGAKLK